MVKKEREIEKCTGEDVKGQFGLGGPCASASQTSQSLPPLDVLPALIEQYNIRRKPFALIWIDDITGLQYETSPEISSIKEEIFSRGFCDSFFYAVNQYGRRQSPIASRHIQPAGASADNRPTEISTKRQVRGSAKRKRSLGETKAQTQRRAPTAPQTPTADGQVFPPLDSNFEEEIGTDEDEYSDIDMLARSIELRTQFRIDDEASVENYTITRFKQIQQTNCKKIAKAWMKVAEAKKQQKHPYNGGKKAKTMGITKNGGQVTTPDYWPTGVRHTEPDHQKKEERIPLLNHLLRVVTRDDIKFQDCGEVTIEMLKKSTNDAAVSIPELARNYLSELYHIITQEQRFLRGEIDGSFKVTVLLPNQEPKGLQKRSKAKRNTKGPRNGIHSTPSHPSIESSPTEQHPNQDLTIETVPMAYQMTQIGTSPAPPERGIVHFPSRPTAELDIDIAFSTLDVSAAGYYHAPTSTSNDTQLSYGTDQVTGGVDRGGFITEASSRFPMAPQFSQNGFQEYPDEMQQTNMQSSSWNPQLFTPVNQSQNNWSFQPSQLGTQQDIVDLPYRSATGNQYFLQPSSQGTSHQSISGHRVIQTYHASYDSIPPSEMDHTGSFCNPSETDL